MPWASRDLKFYMNQCVLTQISVKIPRTVLCLAERKLESIKIIGKMEIYQ